MISATPACRSPRPIFIRRRKPGGSLYGLNNSNPFNPDFLPQGSLNGVIAPDRVASSGDYWGEGGHGKVPGGIITFGGGVALYKKGQVLGGLGVSGDGSCADHAVAYRMRQLAGADEGIPPGVGAGGTDNISYLSPGEGANGFKQPHCFPSEITP